MILPARQVVPPVALLPEPESLHLLVAVTEGGVAVGSPAQVEVAELGEVGPDDLVSVHEYDLLQVEREENVQEEDLVAPDDPLLVGLLVKPPRPFVLDVLVVEAVPLGVLRDEVLQRGGQEVLQDPELDRSLGGFHHGEHHDLEQPLVEVAGGDTEDVEALLLLLLPAGRAAGELVGEAAEPAVVLLLPWISGPGWPRSRSWAGPAAWAGG